MFRLFSRFVLVIALCFAIGGHWVALQSIAWTRMLADNVRTESFVDAIAKTFDGEHPCRLCHAVQKGKTQEKKSASQVANGKVDLMYATRTVVMIPPYKDLSFAVESRSACAEAPTPLVPPPRYELA